MPDVGDNAALDRLVLEHLPHALRFAVRLTGDLNLAEDLVQESLLRVSRAWPQFRAEATFRTWLFRIVINAFRDGLKRRRDEALPDELNDERGIDPQSAAMAGELGELVARLVSALPPRQREVLVLSAYEQLSAREVAEVAGISEANVYATLHAARSRLRTQLAPYLSEN